MFLILPIVFLALCFTSVIISRRMEARLKKFLGKNTEIADEKSLKEYKSVVRVCMHLTLAQLGIIGISLCVIGLLIWLNGSSGALSVPLLGLALGFGKDVGKLEEKARSLTSANKDLDRRYKEISTIWSKKALPDF
jgi:hypothetical protein